VARDGLYFQTLDDCRGAAQKLATKFEEVGGQYPAKSADSTIFGKLTDSSGLAAILDQVETVVDSELGKVASNLRSIERALDKVEDNIRDADKASGADR
jgi:hypothetical protein